VSSATTPNADGTYCALGYHGYYDFNPESGDYYPSYQIVRTLTGDLVVCLVWHSHEDFSVVSYEHAVLASANMRGLVSDIACMLRAVTALGDASYEEYQPDEHCDPSIRPLGPVRMYDV
jgi:hypothetical protein